MLVGGGGDCNVHRAAIPEVGNGDAAAVQNEVTAIGVADLAEGSVAIVVKIAIALPPMPGRLSKVRRIEERSSLIKPLFGNDVVEKLQLQFGSGSVVHPAVGR